MQLIFDKKDLTEMSERKNKKDEKLYKEWLEKVVHGDSLKLVPDEFKTAELCLTAVQQDGEELVYVPEALREQVKKTAGMIV